MTPNIPFYDITKDDLSGFGPDPAFVTFGEVMVRETPADHERPERTRLVRLSMAGSEYTLAIGLARLGIPSSYITRVPDNPYGRAVRNIAREQGVDTRHIVWAPKTDLMGRLIYEIGRTPRRDVAVYQRKCSAASQLDAGMVDWGSALRGARLFHTSGISFGLSTHSGYGRNYNYEAFREAMAHKPEGCLVGLDFNYRSTLWPKHQAAEMMEAIIGEHVDILVTTIEDMADLYGIGCGQYSAKQICDGDIGRLEDDDLCAFAEADHAALHDTHRGHHHPLPRQFRAAPVGVGGSRRGRHLHPLPRNPADHALGPVGGRRHLERRLLLRAVDRELHGEGAGERRAGRGRGHPAEADPDVRPAHRGRRGDQRAPEVGRAGWGEEDGAVGAAYVMRHSSSVIRQRSPDGVMPRR